MTIWFSLLRYSLLDPGNESFIGLLELRKFLTDPASSRRCSTRWSWWAACSAFRGGGTLLALLMDSRSGAADRALMVIAPFFVMPDGQRPIWKDADASGAGLFCLISSVFGLQPDRWFTNAPLTAIVLIVAWQWRRSRR